MKKYEGNMKKQEGNMKKQKGNMMKSMKNMKKRSYAGGEGAIRRFQDDPPLSKGNTRSKFLEIFPSPDF